VVREWADGDPLRVEPGVLVSNTLICEASRLREEVSRSPGLFDEEDDHARRLFDLFSTIECAVLYERIYTLPARLEIEGEELDLRDQLLASGVLRELDLCDDHQQIARLIVEGLAHIKDSVTVQGDRPIDYDSEVRATIENFLTRSDTARQQVPHGSPSLNVLDTIDEGLDFVLHRGNRSFEEFGRDLIKAIQYQSSGTLEGGTSILRDMFYIYAAEYKGLPYWPNTARVDFARDFPNFMDKGARLKLYVRFAKELGTNLESIKQVFDAKIVFIPPFSAIVLDRSTSPSDIASETLKLRHEFMWLRRDMEELDREMLEADTFGKMQRVARKQMRLSETIGEQFQRSNSIWVERAFKYIPEMVKPALSPCDPTKYGPGLLLQPIEWLMDAFRRRPIAMFFEAKAKLDSISRYQTLIAKVFKTDMRGLEKLIWVLPKPSVDDAAKPF
jgi:hypothetical protein